MSIHRSTRARMRVRKRESMRSWSAAYHAYSSGVVTKAYCPASAIIPVR